MIKGKVSPAPGNYHNYHAEDKRESAGNYN
jgi:hypothetical protein